MGMRILLVDDEPLARARLRALLDACHDPLADPPERLGGFVVGEAAHAVQAMEQLQHHPWDVCLLDIHMPGMDGLSLAARVQSLSHPPAIVFVTAHAEHALDAFDLDAVDYLTKPVRHERLQQALDRAGRRRHPVESSAAQTPAVSAPDFLLIHERGGTERVPVAEVVYLKAELKYVTVRTPQRAYIFDGSLHELETAHPGRWLRVHRNALVARHRMRALDKVHLPGDDAESWQLRLDGVPEPLAVSRRQLAQVRDAMAEGAC